MEFIHVDAKDILEISVNLTAGSFSKIVTKINMSVYSNDDTAQLYTSFSSNTSLFELDIACGQLVFTGIITNTSLNVDIFGDAVIDLEIKPVFVQEKEYVE